MIKTDKMSTTTNGSQFTEILTAAAEKLGLKNYSVDPNLGTNKGDGFLSEMLKASIVDEDNNETMKLVIKKAPVEMSRREATCITSAYSSEIYFYTTIIPKFIKFQKDKGVTEISDFVPNYITSVDKIGEEMIVLEDVTASGFEMKDRKVEFDDEHCRYIFGIYGRFHAISFCLKDQKPEEYAELIKPMRCVLAELGTKQGFSHALYKLAQKVSTFLDAAQYDHVREKFKKYVVSTSKLYTKSLEYTGIYSGILHGDCWSNNMMFKYQNSKIKNIKLLDFQLTQIGTPVYDLSYFLYSGGSKELYDNLEDYLDVYYASFSEAVRLMGSDPAELLPRHSLSEEWKSYCKFGMLISLLLIQVKLITPENTVEVIENNKSDTGLISANIDEELFKKKVLDIVFHMNEINAL